MIKSSRLEEGKIYKSGNNSQLTYLGFSRKYLAAKDLADGNTIWLHTFMAPSGRIIEFTCMSNGDVAVDEVE